MPQAQITWHDATQTPPPFDRYVLVLTGFFADPARQAETSLMMVARVVKDSPNDEGKRLEYQSWKAGESPYHEYQFYLQSSEKAWMGQIDVALHGDSDFCDLYSDAISHWAECPGLPPLAGEEEAA